MKEFGWLSGLFVPMGRIRHHGGPSHELDAPHPCGARPMDAVDAAHWWRVCQPTGLLAGQTGPRMWAYRWGDWAADAPHLEVSDASHHGVPCVASSGVRMCPIMVSNARHHSPTHGVMGWAS